jgi:hypothetical protein
VLYSKQRYIRFKEVIDNLREGPSILVLRSTRSKALVRLIN